MHIEVSSFRNHLVVLAIKRSNAEVIPVAPDNFRLTLEYIFAQIKPWGFGPPSLLVID